MYVFGTCVIILQQNLQVKNNTVIDAGVVLRIAAVKRAVRDENDISLMINACIIVQRQMESAGDNSDNLIVPVPVVGPFM